MTKEYVERDGALSFYLANRDVVVVDPDGYDPRFRSFAS